MFLLVGVFLAVWVFTLPDGPETPFAARPEPTPTPAAVGPTRPVSTPLPPSPTPTRRPTPTPTPALPTPTPTPLPTPTPTPTPPMITRPPPTPTPEPSAPFLQVRRPVNLAVVRGRPSIEVSGSTLPWSIVEILYIGQGRSEQDFRVQADSGGDFAATVPLSDGVNVIEVIGYHSASTEQARHFLQITYDPRPLPLEVIITEPERDATVTSQVLTVGGRSVPEARIVINDLIPARPDESGHWQAEIVLQPGANEIRATASRGEETVVATIIVTYAPDS